MFCHTTTTTTTICTLDQFCPPRSLLEWTAVITVRMQTLAFFHAKRPVTIPPKSIIVIPLSDHVAVLPPPLNHGERKEKSPNCSTTLFGHCNATRHFTNPWDKCWTQIADPMSNQGQSMASKLDVQLWAFALTTRSRSLSLGAECSFIYYWAQWHPAWCQACQVSTWDQSFKFFTAPKRLSLPAQRWSTWFATWPAWSM